MKKFKFNAEHAQLIKKHMNDLKNDSLKEVSERYLGGEAGVIIGIKQPHSKLDWDRTVAL